MLIYQLYQDTRSQNDNTIMISDKPYYIIGAYDKYHKEIDDALSHPALLKGWYVDVWEGGAVIHVIPVEDFKVSIKQAAEENL